MSGFVRLLVASAICWTASAPSLASPRTVRFDIQAVGLAEALDRISKVAKVNLLYDSGDVPSRRAPDLHAELSVADALEVVLKDTGLVVRQVNAQSYLLARSPEPPHGAREAAVPEIIVIGRRSQNADIRRRATDIQPYRVLSKEAISSAQSDSTEELFRSRISSNTLMVAASQSPTLQMGSVRSQVDLRGLGTAQTLILVDGRRMPSVPALNDFLQPDINGLPTSAIERVETLGGTAGGIYGPGATGGVINIILRHDLPKLWVAGRSGISAHGDAAQRRIEGGFSFEAGGGSTKVSLLLSETRDEGLRFGDREFVARARELRLLRNRSGFAPPASPSVNIRDYLNQPLVLTQTFGGGALGTKTTTIPLDPNSIGVDAAALKAGAGGYDFRLSPDGTGSLQSLVAASRSGALVASAHQDLGTHVELFANVLRLMDEGTAVGAGMLQTFTLGPGQNGNPFANNIQVSFPASGLAATSRIRTDTSRTTVGVVARLGGGWSLETDAALGRSVVTQRSPTKPVLSNFGIFTDMGAFAAAVAGLRPGADVRRRLNNRLRDVSLRVAGSVVTLPGGPLFLTVSAENRTETARGQNQFASLGSSTPAVVDRPQRLEVRSVVAEARVPLISGSSAIAPLRGLELQLAVRSDRHRIIEPILDQYNDLVGTDVEARHSTVAFTVGGKVVPAEGVIVRASYATGYLPPTPGQIVPARFSVAAQSFADPRRPGEGFSFSPFTYTTFGSPNLEPEHAETVAAGLVLQPLWMGGLSISVDYTRIAKSNEIATFAQGLYPYFLAHEAEYPGRVTRASLTAADIAKGYTGGRITAIDGTSLNVGRSVLQAIDLDLGFKHDFRAGQLGLHGTATWIPSLRRRDDPAKPYGELAAHSDGPLNWKAAVGAEWRQGPVSAAVNTQIYGGYSVTQGSPAVRTEINALSVLVQGREAIPLQSYSDLDIAYRTRTAAGTTAVLRLGIRNLLNHTPPFIVNTLGGFDYGIGYSPYGSPVGRRFTLSASVEL